MENGDGDGRENDGVDNGDSGCVENGAGVENGGDGCGELQRWRGERRRISCITSVISYRPPAGGANSQWLGVP